MKRHVRTFQDRFADLVRSGAKKQTIRTEPKRPIAPGDVIDCRRWTGLPYRSPQEPLATGRVKEVATVRIGEGGIEQMTPSRFLLRLDPERMAIEDGFSGFPDLLDWFRGTHGELPFDGILIRWELDAGTPGEYPTNWKEIATRIKDLAGWQCERCDEPNDRKTGHVLTVHHLDGRKENCADWNLAALCQRCHLRIQSRIRLGQLFMPEILSVSEWFRPHLDGYLRSVS